jgi:hypothetical protein
MRQQFIDQFYKLLGLLIQQNNGYKFLSNPIVGLPTKGVYFFFEEGIYRNNSTTHKVMRVGTHSTQGENNTTLTQRLRQHKGNLRNGGGNHRGSVYRKHVGHALINLNGLNDIYPNWGVGNHANQIIIQNELPHEITTSNIIRQYPFTYLKVPTFQERSLIEKCSIEILSNSNQGLQIDVPHINWLGFSAQNPLISNSHLWNVHYVNDYEENNQERYTTFLNLFQNLINQQ